MKQTNKNLINLWETILLNAMQLVISWYHNFHIVAIEGNVKFRFLLFYVLCFLFLFLLVAELCHKENTTKKKTKNNNNREIVVGFLEIARLEVAPYEVLTRLIRFSKYFKNCKNID